MMYMDITIILETSLCGLEENIKKINQVFGIIMFIQKLERDLLDNMSIRIVEDNVELLREKLVNLMLCLDKDDFNKWYNSDDDIYKATMDSLTSSFQLREEDVKIIIGYAVNSMAGYPL